MSSPPTTRMVIRCEDGSLEAVRSTLNTAGVVLVDDVVHSCVVKGYCIVNIPKGQEEKVKACWPLGALEAQVVLRECFT